MGSNPFGRATYQILSGLSSASLLLRKQDGSSLRKAFGQFVALSDMSSRLNQMGYSAGWRALRRRRGRSTSG